MSTRKFCLIFSLISVLTSYAQNNPATKSAPPFHGTIFIDQNIITADDPICYSSLFPDGQGMRAMFDRRVNNWINVNAHLFTAYFSDDLKAEIQVNPEFGSYEMVEAEAFKYAKIISQLPTCLRKDVKTVSIHKGTQLFGGGNNNLLIHTGQADLYERDGILEEALVHEAAHTSLDAHHALEMEWLRAQQLDPAFISKYAQENPKREDIAETFLLFMAITIRPDRISDELKQTIINTIPNRLSYLQSQEFNFYPLIESENFEDQPATEQEIGTETEIETENKPAEERNWSAQQLSWVAFTGSVPENSVSGGQENGNNLPVCRGFYNGATHPGKLLSNNCNIGWGGKEIQLSSFEVLVGQGEPLLWLPYAGNIPSGAVEAGIENERILYVGQVTRADGSVHAGKVFGASGNFILNYGYGGKEITEKNNFRILVR